MGVVFANESSVSGCGKWRQDSADLLAQDAVMERGGLQAATSCDPDEMYLWRLGILSVASEENVVVCFVGIALLAASRGPYEE